MAKNPRTEDANSPPGTARKNGLTRRSYVRSLAAAAVATTAVAGTTASADEGDSLDLDVSGDVEIERRDGYTYLGVHDECRITVSDGETIENLLIDNDGQKPVQFVARGIENFEIRNVGITDRQPGSSSAIFGVGCSGDGLIENVYLEGGEGDWTDKHQGEDDETASSKAVFTHDDHTGDLTIRDLYAGPFTDNVFYCDNQGSDGNLHFENVYVYGGCISVFRTGGGGSHTMRNCHVENAGAHPDNDHDGARDVWLRSGQNGPELDVYDSQLGGAGTGIIADGGPVRLHGETDYGDGSGDIVEADDAVSSDPNPTVPDSVPASAEDAAGGN